METGQAVALMSPCPPRRKAFEYWPEKSEWRCREP